MRLGASMLWLGLGLLDPAWSGRCVVVRAHGDRGEAVRGVLGLLLLALVEACQVVDVALEGGELFLCGGAGGDHLHQFFEAWVGGGALGQHLDDGVLACFVLWWLRWWVGGHAAQWGQRTAGLGLRAQGRKVMRRAVGSRWIFGRGLDGRVS